jgi:hypothetical protein
LQIVRIPTLGNDIDRFGIANLADGNRARDSRPLGAYSSNGLRAKVFLFQKPLGHEFLLARSPLLREGAICSAPLCAFPRMPGQLLSCLGVRMEQEVRASYWIADHDK